MFCEKCGTQLSDDAEFCASCGVRIQKTISNSTSQQESKKDTGDSVSSTAWTDNKDGRTGKHKKLVIIAVIITMAVIAGIIVITRLNSEQIYLSRLSYQNMNADGELHSSYEEQYNDKNELVYREYFEYSTGTRIIAKYDEWGIPQSIKKDNKGSGEQRDPIEDIISKVEYDPYDNGKSAIIYIYGSEKIEKMGLNNCDEKPFCKIDYKYNKISDSKDRVTKIAYFNYNDKLYEENEWIPACLVSLRELEYYPDGKIKIKKELRGNLLGLYASFVPKTLEINSIEFLVPSYIIPGDCIYDETIFNTDGNIADYKVYSLNKDIASYFGTSYVESYIESHPDLDETDETMLAEMENDIENELKNELLKLTEFSFDKSLIYSSSLEYDDKGRPLSRTIYEEDPEALYYPNARFNAKYDDQGVMSLSEDNNTGGDMITKMKYEDIRDKDENIIGKKYYSYRHNDDDVLSDVFEITREYSVYE
ncbi:MAG: zinc ribbon domain-containing protein [Lachnospiraceae bacterium]|nr:zinc ribbon domain-containing protein [Lachnospiraceae bacterium]